MSVVNKMLQDLEARQTAEPAISADYQPPSGKWKLAVLAGAVLVLLLAGAGYWWLTQGSASADTARQTNREATSLPAKQMIYATRPVDAAGQSEQKLAQPAQVDESRLAASQPTVVEQSAEPDNLSAEPVVDLAEQASQLETVDKPETNASTPEIVTEVSSQFSMQDSSVAEQRLSLRQRIADALAANDNSLAISLLQQLLADEPDNIDAAKKLAGLLFAKGDARAAARQLQQSLQLAPQRSDLLLMLARLHSGQNQHEQAFNLLSQHQPAAFIELDYLAYRASLAQRLGNYPIAKQDYLQLSQLDASNAKWWLGLGIAEEQLQANRAALLAYQKAYALQQLDTAVVDFIQQRMAVLAGNDDQN